ncbi:MAG: glycoside hydrolase family 3 C-terminal domain-containing protein [Segetibacter sp.]
MKTILLIAFITTLSATTISAQETVTYKLCDNDFRAIYMRDNLPKDAVYTNQKASAEARAKDVISRLTFDEKLMLTGGWKTMHFPAVERLGLPPIYFADASQGLHIKNVCVQVEKSTAFPSTIALAATWNAAFAYTYAKSIGEECRAWGFSVLLGPGLNIYRHSAGGRNFEYLGEDPFLTSQLGVNYIKGLQAAGTLATIKHFIGNDQEFVGHVVNIKISERALREIYLPPFEAGIKEGKALAVMTGNNQVNGFPGAADKPLTGNVLREEYGFKGVVMSDWANTMYWQDKLNLELTSGHSLLMANNEPFAAYIRQEIKDHPERKKGLEKGLDTMVFYNLFTFFKSGIYDRAYRNAALLSTFEAHKKIALQTAEEGITLLKNDDNILPIKPATAKKIVVLGTDEALKAYTGKGSGMVEGYNHVDYVTGLRNVYGNKVVYKKDISNDEISSADVVLYFTTKPSGESFDIDFNLPNLQDTVKMYAQLNKNLVVIHSGGNGLAMPWLSSAKAFVFAYLLGQERGVALANVISGKVNPSGKLPFTIEKDFNEGPGKHYNKMLDGTYYWGGNRTNSTDMKKKFGDLEIPYNEGIYVGYRWYEKKSIQPQFPFGYGLSYTTFSFGKLSSSAKKILKDKGVAITCTVTNTGTVAGAEVVQLYVTDVKSTIDRPVKELKGFKKVFLQPGESKKVTLDVGWKDLAFWNEKDHQWKVEQGEFIVSVGSSSQDIKQRISISY